MPAEPTRTVNAKTRPASAKTRTARWISLSEASRMLGIAPGTLRRWADEGSIPVFTTPGGHRRFSPGALRAFLPTARAARPDLSRLGASAERMTRAYRSDRTRRAAAWSWADGLSDVDREAFRERGRVLVELLLAHLDAAGHRRSEALPPGSADPHGAGARLLDAKRLAAEYGRETAGRGCSLSDAVQGFLRFRSPFTDELAALARRRGLDTREATELLADAEAAMDELLVAMMTGHTLEAGPRKHSRPNAQPNPRPNPPTPRPNAQPNPRPGHPTGDGPR